MTKEKTERITLTYASLLAEVVFGGSAPAGASLSFDSEVARRSQDGIAPFVRHNTRKDVPLA